MDTFDPTNSTDIEALKEYYAAQSQVTYTNWEILMPFIIIGVLFVIAFTVLTIIGMWGMFKKAGEKPWKSIIPVYDFFVLAKICNAIKLFFILLALTLVSAVISACTDYIDEEAISMVISIVYAIVSIATLVFYVFFMNKVSHAFGHGKGYTVGLVFLSVVFVCIIGLGNSKYTPERVFVDKKTTF